MAAVKVKKPRNRMAQDRLDLLEKKVAFLLEWKRHDRGQR